MKSFKLASIALCLGALLTAPAYASGGQRWWWRGAVAVAAVAAVVAADLRHDHRYCRRRAPRPTDPAQSFGLADLKRPAGGNGCLKDVGVHSHLGGFWVEYPGSKNTAWLASSAGQSRISARRRTAPVSGALADRHEVPQRLHVLRLDRRARGPSRALVPFTAPATAYQVSIDGWPAPVEGTYVGVGLTDSALLYSNLETSAKVWLRLMKSARPTTTRPRSTSSRLDGMNGPVLGRGEIPFNQTSTRWRCATTRRRRLGRARPSTAWILGPLSAVHGGAEVRGLRRRSSASSTTSSAR